ncbi:MAG: hypothetical protein VCB42_05105, partial [Myxococcota bacterium]
MGRELERSHAVTGTRTRFCWALTLALCLLPAGTRDAMSETAQEDPSPVASRPDPAARLPQGGSASEYWDLTVELDSGHRVVARFIITNVGLGNQNGVAFGHLIHPDGTRVAFRNGKRRSRWRLTAAQRNLDIGGCHLFMESDPYRLWINKDDVRIDLRFSPKPSVPTPADATPRGYHLRLLALATPVVGSLWFGDETEGHPVRGQASLIHTWMREAEAELVTRRIDFYGFGAASAYGVTIRTPAGDDTQWFAAKRGDDTWVSTTAFDSIP